MRKIIVLEFMSMDGVIQAPGGPKEDTSGGFKYGGWTAPYFDGFAGKVMEKQMAGKYDLLLGRKTYDIFSNYWPENADGWPGINKKIKYVVSKTLKDPKWENTTVLKSVEGIKKLKKHKGPVLQVYGSSNLMQTLMKHDLVDEYWLKIFPLTLGKGKKLFGSGTLPAGFRLTDNKVSPRGVVIANYKRAGKVKTGSF